MSPPTTPASTDSFRCAFSLRGYALAVTSGIVSSVSAKQPDAGGGGGDDAATDAATDAAIDAPPIACTETTCTNDVLEVCGSNGMVESTENCALGCYTDGTRCNEVDPSNGLASQLDQAAQQGDVTLPDGARINTDTGTVTSANGDAIAVATATVQQAGGPTLRVLLARSFTMDGVRVVGSLPVAFVAREEITIRGVLDASADGATPGPGAQACNGAGAGGAPGTGFFEHPPGSNSGGYPDFVWGVAGAGGGGFGSAGGDGGVRVADYAVGAGGSSSGQPSLVPLRGGCPGNNGSTTEYPTYLGAGGGAVQLVAGRKIHLATAGATKGIVHVGGGGGRAGVLGRDIGQPIRGSAGGGSGGGILFEAPSVVLDDGAGMLAAGGGGGGYGACTPEPNGQDAPPSAATPLGGACPMQTTPASIGGNGATSSAGGVGGNASSGCAGGGGGGLGRIRVNTADGQYTKGANALLRGVETTGMVGKR